METTLSEDGKDVNVLFKELPLTYFDRTGVLSIWKMSYMFQVIRVAAVRSGLSRNFLFTSNREEYRNRTYFVKSQELTVYPALYSKVRQYIQLLGVCSLQYIGKSSYSFLQELKLASTGELVGRCSTLMVLVDKETRRPVQFDRERVKESLPFVRGGGTPQFMNQITDQPPVSTSYRYSVTVAASDTDTNQHVNQSNYFKYCLDCAACGARDHAYSIFSRDIALYPIKSLKALYIRECRAGENLEVTSWEDEEKPYILYFIIKRGTQDIFQSIIRFNCDKAKM